MLVRVFLWPHVPLAHVFSPYLTSIFMSLEIATLHSFWVVMTDATAIRPARSESRVWQFQRHKSETYSVFHVAGIQGNTRKRAQMGQISAAWIAGASDTKYSLTLTQWKSFNISKSTLLTSEWNITSFTKLVFTAELVYCTVFVILATHYMHTLNLCVVIDLCCFYLNGCTMYENSKKDLYKKKLL